MVNILLSYWPMASARLFRLLAGALLFALAGASSHALQLGETAAQITARHGAAAVEDHGRQLAVYYWEGWSAQLEFKAGTVGKLTYRRTGYLEEAEIQALLQANGGVPRWTVASSSGSPTRSWYRADGATAQCAATRPTTMLFQGGHALSPAEAIVTESFLKFDAPTAPAPTAAAATPAPESGRSEPVVLSNATSPPTPTPAPARPAEIWVDEARPEPSLSAVGETATPQPRVKPKTEPSPQPAAATPAAPARPKGSDRLLVWAAVVIGALGLVVKKARRRQPRPAPATTPPPPLSAAPAEQVPSLHTLSWDQFELLVGEIFRRQGYGVELSAALGADGGIDLVLRRDGESIPVQCKHWKTARVTAREMREFFGAMTDAAAPRGVFVTTGDFSRDAREFAAGKSIDLIDGRALARQIAAVQRPEENIFDVTSWLDGFTAQARIFDPECPSCRGAMVIRQNRTTGSAFWGCTTYPRCSGKRDPRQDLLTLPAAA